MMGKKISVIGGDLRQIFAAKHCKEQGFEVSLSFKLKQVADFIKLEFAL